MSGTYFLDQALQALKTYEAPLPLPKHEGWPKSVHSFSELELKALQTALAAQRPLLVRGEPGTGKTQFAHAAAVLLGCQFLSKTLDAQTTLEDLFWSVDSVRRLAEAQVLAVKMSGLRVADTLVDKMKPSSDLSQVDISKYLSEELSICRFTEPGVLWWAYNWKDAQSHNLARGMPQREDASWTKNPGVAVLLDEIDKADPVLPNGLLEVLGTGRFAGPEGGSFIESESGLPPLVIITTNEERELPYAFMRRCVVLDLVLPSDPDELVALLLERGREHAKAWFREREDMPSDRVIERCARLLSEERTRSQKGERPGQAEFLDLLRAVCFIHNDDQARLDELEALKMFIFGKYKRSDSTYAR